MRRFALRGVFIAVSVLTALILSACGDVNPTEQSLARTATAFFAATRAPSAVGSANRPTAVSTPRAPVSVVALATPTPLPAFSGPTGSAGSAVTARVSAAVTQPTATATRVPVATAAQVVTVIADGNVNLRSAPAADAAVVTQLRPGAEVTVVQANVMAEDGGTPWVKVSVGGQTGYVRSDLVGPPHTSALSPTRTPAATP